MRGRSGSGGRQPICLAGRAFLAFGFLLVGRSVLAGPACDGLLQAMGKIPEASHAVACTVASRSLLVVADVHGTNEIPAFVAGVVWDASATHPVRLGIEFIGGMQAALSTYVRSQGTPADRKALFGMGYWASQDGRTSEAMKRLVESIRMLRDQGRNVDLFAMKPDYPGDAPIVRAGGVDAFVNQQIAAKVRKQISQAPGGARVIAFMGSVHAEGAPDEPETVRPVTRQLADLAPTLVTFATQGEAWNCQPIKGCGVHAVKQVAVTDRSPSKVQGHRHLVVPLSVVTASPPVITQAPMRDPVGK